MSTTSLMRCCLLPATLPSRSITSTLAPLTASPLCVTSLKPWSLAWHPARKSATLEVRKDGPEMCLGSTTPSRSSRHSVGCPSLPQTKRSIEPWRKSWRRRSRHEKVKTQDTKLKPEDSSNDQALKGADGSASFEMPYMGFGTSLGL